jgi:transcriptional regulator with XRE-family HTH domain
MSVDIAARFGDNVARVRRASGYSQDETSIRASVHRTEISQIERGLRVPRIDTLIKLMGALEADADELLVGLTWQPGETRRGRFSTPDQDATL